MNINGKIIFMVLLAGLLAVHNAPSAQGQSGTGGSGHNGVLDTFSCPIVGFSVAGVLPSAGASVASGFGGTGVAPVMADLYKPPYLGFGVHFLYKTRQHWVFSVDGNIWFGSDNLQYRTDRLGSVYSRDSIVIGTNGTDANVTCYNRHITMQAGAGKIITLFPKKNPNSGLLLKMGAGYQRGQTIFMLNDVNAPQLDDDNALLYDHQRHGFILTEAIGYWFMSNHANLVNCALTFEVSQLWSRSTRDYVIDYRAGLTGKDNSSYFDLLYTLRFTWMFPLKGKTVREYYFY